MNKEAYKDVHKSLVEDKKYQQILESMSEEERAQTQEFMKRFMGYFQEKVFNPLQEKIKTDPDFKEALYKKAGDVITNKDNKDK